MTDVILNVCRGMGGVSGDLRGPFVRSPTAAFRCISEYQVCLTSGDHGAICVWRDDAGQLRANFEYYQTTLAGDIFKSKTQLRQWLKEWWPKMHEIPYH